MRSQELNILIATSVVEEGKSISFILFKQVSFLGLDIPECDLVIRFNKPNNFSSYMQSKGRARSRENASYVLFMDQSNVEANQRDRMEYDNYEMIEKVRSISLDDHRRHSLVFR